MEGLHITNAYGQGLIHVQKTVLTAMSTGGCGELYDNGADRLRTTLNICLSGFFGCLPDLVLLQVFATIPGQARVGTLLHTWEPYGDSVGVACLTV